MNINTLKTDFWFDQSNSISQLFKFVEEKKCPVNPEKVLNFIQNGYTIFEQAVPHDVIDEFSNELENIRKNPSGFMTSYGTSVHALGDANLNQPLTKLLDLYARSNAARKVLLSKPAQDFLKFMFQDSISLFQSLYFLMGSTQDLHQDPSYVVVDENPHNIIACWVALEDIQPDSGELKYIEGSHKSFIYRYPGDRVHWNPQEDGNPVHDNHLSELRKLAEKDASKVKSFLPKKGDVLFWHSNLAHGGGKNITDNKTRKSIVGHFCPSRTRPHYMNILEDRYENSAHGVKFYSMYYDKNVSF